MARLPRKHVIGILIILGAFVWLFGEGLQRGKSYYKTIEELEVEGAKAVGVRLKVAGDVVKGSLQERGQLGMSFKMAQHGRILPVVYTSTRAIPDTFTDESQVLVEGVLGSDGVFKADLIQAKCASKYEARYQPGALPGA